MNKKSLYFIAIVLLLFSSLYIIKKIKGHPVPQINFSGIALNRLAGGIIDMNTFAGKPLVINFWGTWCGPCRAEFPGFEKAKNKFGNKVNFLMVSDETADKLIKFKQENSYTFFYAQSKKTFKELGLSSVPVTYFYDAKGSLVANIRDPVSEEQLNGYLNKMIKRP